MGRDLNEEMLAVDNRC